MPGASLKNLPEEGNPESPSSAAPAFLLGTQSREDSTPGGGEGTACQLAEEGRAERWSDARAPGDAIEPRKPSCRRPPLGVSLSSEHTSLWLEPLLVGFFCHFSQMLPDG